MKKKIFPIVIMVLSFNILMAQDKYKKYENSQFGFSIDYPELWTLTEGQQSIFSIISPQTSATDQVKENMNLSIIKSVPEGMPLKDYTEQSLKALKGYLKKFKKTSTDYIKINGNDYAKTIYEHEVMDFRFTVIFYQTIINGRGYNFACTKDPSDVTYAPVFDRIINTFVVK
jgi:hypothetical protein